MRSPLPRWRGRGLTPEHNTLVIFPIVEQLNKLPLVKRIPTAQLQFILSVLVLVPGYIRPAGANRRRSQNRQPCHAALSRNGPDPKSKRKCKSRGRGAAQRLGQVRQCNGGTSGTGAGGAGSDLQVEVGTFASRDPGTNRNQVQSSVMQRRDLLPSPPSHDLPA